jgi:glucose-1-phosphate cytidylyltransferase
MKVGILAGGKGTRFAEETEFRPKPMIEIGGKPILWHIMKIYDHYGFQDFVIALGYKGEQIKKWILDYCPLSSDLIVHTRTGQVTSRSNDAPNWTVELMDTGLNTNTGGRIKRLIPSMGNETFCLTWGDGVSNVNINDLVTFHKSHGKIATLTAVHPPARFGHFVLDGNQVKEFTEKPQTQEGLINGAFFVLEPAVSDYIDNDDTLFEREPLERLAADGQLMAYIHTDFWQCMDTLRDKYLLQRLWENNQAPWKTWETDH